MKRACLTLKTALACGIVVSAAVAAEPAQLEVWAVDPLVKVFRDAAPAGDTKAIAEVARGEHATLQIVVRCGAEVTDLRVGLPPLTREGAADQALPAGSIRFVGFVPVDRPIQTPPKDQLRKPPAEFPDPLLEVNSITLKPGQAQPVWVTIPIPAKTAPGLYRGTASISGSAAGQPVTAKLPVAVQVFGTVIDRSRLWVTNWFAMHWSHMQIQPEPDSPAYWQLLRRYARNMADHRQNVAWISPLSLAKFQVGKDGRLDIDFSPFDRWVTIFKEDGVIGRIEGGHLGGRAGEWASPFVVQIRQIKNDQITSATVDPASSEADEFYAQFLPALVKHLRDKDWLGIYMQHLADEPIAENVASYRAIAALVRKYGPELRIIEACHTRDLAGAIDIWVPQLNFYHQDYDYYRQRQAAGEEVWFYTCVFPQGEYANRFIEQPLLKTRLLHWLNFRYGATGYLHWGYNWWTGDDPYTHTTRPHGSPPYLPAGDAWIVYPGKEGPIDSIRFEAMRDGIADYELLCMLGERDRDLATRLAGKHVLAFDRYDCDVPSFRATRREMLERLSRPISLREAADRAGLLIGAAIYPEALREPPYADTLAREFNFITSENAFKWRPIHPAPDRWNFAPADALVEFAAKHGMKVKGHTLVWHAEMPDWINAQTSAEQIRQAMAEHIRTVVGRYKGKVYAWDVVNEAVDDQKGLRKTLLLDKLGDGYIAEAFRLAHETDPDALLIYNDYGAEGLGQRSDRVYELVKKLLADGVPIHGVGLQMHISAKNYPKPEDIAANVRRLAALGLKVNISEMDVRVKDVPGDRAAKLAVQYKVYHDVIESCVGLTGFMGVTFWGFTDAHSWVDSFFGADDPLLFDEQYQPKPAYEAVRDALLGAKRS